MPLRGPDPHAGTRSPLVDLEAQVREIVPLPGEAKVADVFLGRRFDPARRRVPAAGAWSRLELDAEARRAA